MTRIQASWNRRVESILQPLQSTENSCCSFLAVEMASGIKSCDESLIGRRVVVSWPKHKACTKGVVLHRHSGKNLVMVVCTDGLEEYLNLKRGNGEPVNDVFSNQATEKCYPTHASSNMLPEWGASKAYGDELVGCKVKIWRIKSSTFSEGVIASYNCSNKKHLVVYTDGVEEMLNLSKHVETAAGVSADQAQKKHSPAPEFSPVYADDDMNAHLHARKKHKGPSSNHMTSCASPVMSRVPKTPKLEAEIFPTNYKQSSIISNDGLLNVNGYKVKASAAPILEAIFEKYGDITARCIFRSPSVIASLLQVVCNVVQRLQHHDVEAILSELKLITNEVTDVEASKINISWLKEHLAQLRKIVPFKEKSIELKKTKTRIGMVSRAVSDELKERQAELLLAEQRYKEAEKRVGAVNLVGRKIEDDILESESEEYIWRRRLDDLL